MAGAVSDLYIALTANIAPLLAAFREASVAGEEFAVRMKEISAEINTSMASAMKTGAGAEGMTAATAEMQAENDKLMASFREVGASSTAMAAEVESSYGAMAARTAELSQGMVTAEKEAVVANNALGESMAATAVKSKEAAGAMEASQTKALGLADAAGITSGKLGQVASTLGVSKNTMLGVGVAIGGIGYESIKMAGDFQQASTKLVTSAGEDAKALDDVIRPGLIDRAGQLGVSAIQLAKDMYPIESAGYHGQAALNALEAAEKGAAAEGAEGVKVADALTSALHDYYPTATSAADVTKHSTEIMSAFLGATSQGKMSFDELSGSLNNILAPAAKYHIALEDILGVLASMTSHGITARQASENLNHAMVKLAGTGSQSMREWAKVIGTSMQEINDSLSSKGMSGTLEMLDEKIKAHLGPDGVHVMADLRNAVSGADNTVKQLVASLASGEISSKDFKKAVNGLTEQEKAAAAPVQGLIDQQVQMNGKQVKGAEIISNYGAMWRNVTGDMTTAKVAIFTTGENTDYTNESVKKIGDSMKNGKALTEAWAEVQKNFNQRLKEATEGLKAMFIAIGMQLLPILTPVVAKIAEFAHWISQHTAVAKVLALVLGVTLTLAFAALAGKGLMAVLNLSASTVLGFGKMTKAVMGYIPVLKKLVVATEESETAQTAASERGAAARLAIMTGNGIKWLAIQAGTLAKGLAGWAAFEIRMVAVWAGYYAKMVLAATVNGAKWLAATTANFVKATASAVVESGKTLAAWAAASAKMLASAIADGAKWLAAWIATGVAAAASSVIEAAVAAAAWVAANLAMIAATGGIILAIGAVIAIGYELVKHWGDIKRIAGEVWDWVKNKFTEVKDAISNAIHSLVTTVAQKIGEALDFFRRLPGDIMNAIGDTGRILWAAGYNIIVGLYNGIIEMWNKCKAFVSSIADWISQHKGPVERDAQLLNPHGRAIIQGLINGMVSQIPALTSHLGDVTKLLTSVGGTVDAGVNLSVAGGVNGVGAGSLPLSLSGGVVGNAAGTNIQIVVNGHVWQTQDLVKAIQTELLRHNIRNPSNGLTYNFG